MGARDGKKDNIRQETEKSIKEKEAEGEKK